MLAQFEKFAISKNQQQAVQGGASDSESDFQTLLNQAKQAEAERQAEAKKNSMQNQLNAAFIRGSMQIAAAMFSIAGAVPKR